MLAPLNHTGSISGGVLDQRPFAQNSCFNESVEAVDQLPISQSQDGKIGLKKRERGPDLVMSRKRIELEEQLRGELAQIAVLIKKYATLESLKNALPNARIWGILTLGEENALLRGEFKPKFYARALTARFNDVTVDAIKKDRAKLRHAAKSTNPA
ncbi:hypothetical protein [Paludibaculum fermentans]|uniref:hypothetical protein n=1 Tax=Paludibaculum fermentans TaxID=1473598 RepID=UPI003EBA6714